MGEVTSNYSLDPEDMVKDLERRATMSFRILNRASEGLENAKRNHNRDGSPGFEDHFEAAYRLFQAEAAYGLADERYNNHFVALLRVKAEVANARVAGAPESKA